MYTVKWQGFGRGQRFSCDYFPGIYQNQLRGISCNPFRRNSNSPFWELLLSHSKEFIATNSGEFILPIPGNLSLPLLEKMWTNFGEIHGNFHRKVHQNKISGNFLGTISKTFSLQGSSGIS